MSGAGSVVDLDQHEYNRHHHPHHLRSLNNTLSGGLCTCNHRDAISIQAWPDARTPDRLCSLAGHFTLIVPLFIQVYKWVPANLLLGVTLQWTSIPSGGGRNTDQSLHATETGISSGLVSH